MNRLNEYNRTWKNLNRVYSDYAKKIGMSEAKFLILYTLYTQPETAQKDLCKELAMPKQTVSAVLASLQKEGLVKVGYGANSKKAKTVSLNPDGAKKTAALIQPIIDAEKSALDKIKESDFKAMIKSYDALKVNLENLLTAIPHK